MVASRRPRVRNCLLRISNWRRASVVGDAYHAPILRRLASFLSPSQRRLLRRAALFVRIHVGTDLDALALWYGTDKSSWHHDYTRLYERHLRSRRDRVRSVLEIGVGGTTSFAGYESSTGGQSLHMWRRYFPNASILGIDIHPKAIAGDRILFEQGDQSDREFLARVIRTHGPFDLVIDDGSHTGHDITTSFSTLWDAVRPGGWYVVEDLFTAYHPDFGGGPPGTPGTSAELIKTLVDDVLLREGDTSLIRKQPDLQPSIAEMHVYGNIVFFERAK